MARASTPTLLPLDRFAYQIGVHPLFFNSVIIPDLVECEKVVLQYSWQSGGEIGREDISRAIAQAEERISEVVGFKPRPTWIEDEQYAFAPRSGGKWIQVPTKWGKYIAGGIESKTLIEADAEVVYSGDNNGYAGIATVVVTTAVDDPEEIALFYPDKNGDDAWEIRPITVSIDSGVATITCRREQLVLEDLWEDFKAEPVDGLDDDNFLETVDVYRRFHDPQTQVQLLWAPYCMVCGGSESGCSSCSYTTQYGCLLGREMDHGFVTVTPGAWDTDTNSFTSQPWSIWEIPRRARLWYRAGWKWERGPRPHVDMDPRFERAIALYALCLMDGPICVCLSEAYEKWNVDYALNDGGTEESTSYRFSKQLLENPLGSKAGAVEAWRLVKDVL